MICSIDGCRKTVIARGWCSCHHTRWLRHGDPLAGGTPKGEPTKWLQQHIDYCGSDCLIWPFATNANGYANGSTALGKNICRVMCKLAHGEPPSSKHQVAHSCGNGKGGCINPRHLRWDTRKGNERDKLIHGTHNRGERCGTAILTRKEVRRIRRFKGFVTQKWLADKFGVSEGCIKSVQRKATWAWLA